MINATDRIKELMDMMGWSSYELSNQTGISTNAIYDWFKIGAAPTLPNIIKVCEAAGITIEQFFCGTKNFRAPDEEKILREWFSLSELEKETIRRMIETFQILKR